MLDKLLILFLCLLFYNISYCQLLGIYEGRYNNERVHLELELKRDNIIVFVGLNLGSTDTIYGYYSAHKKIMNVNYKFYDFKMEEKSCKDNQGGSIKFCGGDYYVDPLDCFFDKIQINDKSLQMNDYMIESTICSYFIPFNKIISEKEDSNSLNINFSCDFITFNETVFVDINKCYELKIHILGQAFDSKRFSNIIIKNKRKLIVDGIIFKWVGRVGRVQISK